MATSGSWSKQWESSTWSGYPKAYKWTGNWSKSGNTITLSNMTLQIVMLSGSGWGSASDSVTVTGGSAQTVSWTMSGATSNTVSLSNTSFSVSSSSTSSTIECAISGENTGRVDISYDATAVAPSGGSITNIVVTQDSITATVAVSSWGTGTNKRLRLAVLEDGHYITTAGEPQYAADDTSGSLSATLTVDNNSTTYNNPSWTIQPSTNYSIGLFAETSYGNYRYDYPLNPVRTLAPTPISVAKLYGPVNGQSKKITKLYGSVNGRTKKITKLYGSANGQTKLIYEDTNA